MEELSQPSYTVYSQAVREKLATAAPGEVMFRHPHFSQPVFLRFPRPAVLKGSYGMKRWPKPKQGELDGVVSLAKDLKPGDIQRMFEHVEHAKRSEKIAEVIEELSISPGQNSERIIRRIVGGDDRVFTGHGGLTNPVNDI